MLQKIAGKVQCDKHNQMLHSSDVGRMEVSTIRTSDTTIRHSKSQRGSPVWRSTLEKSQLHGYVEINEDKQEGRHRRKAIHVFSVWQGLYPITTASAGPWEDPHRWKAVHMRSVWRWSKPRQCRMDDLTPLGCRDLAHFGQSKPPQSWRHDRTHSLTVG